MDNKNKIRNLLSKKKNKVRDNLLLDELFTIPIKDKGAEISRFDRPLKEGVSLQCDLLFLPSTFGYKYLLVCVDLAFNRVDF